MSELFTFEEAEAAMCIWEDCLLRRANGNDSVFEWLSGNEGAASARSMCLELAKDLERSYEIAFAAGFDECFDWEFVPRWIDLAMIHTRYRFIDHGWVAKVGDIIAEEYKRGIGNARN